MIHTAKDINADLLKKYNYKAFMYTEYPHKRYWSDKFGEEDLKDALKSLTTYAPAAPILFYVHMPYCQKQCYFCTCRVDISLNYEDVKSYMKILFAEIDLYREFFETNGLKPNIKEIHLGGGSPTFIYEKEFDQLIEKLQSLTDIKNLDEFSIEIDPRRVKAEKMRYYHEKGISRISFGVQDFDLEVQKAINRVQPASLTEKLITPEIRKLFRNGVNFDIICGLPRQTVESMRQTMEKIVEMGPDRICLNYLDLAPQFNPHQLLMPQADIPDGLARKKLFLEALEVLSNGGYVRTGYDHFAKPTDSVAKAKEKKEMIWNSLGSTPGRCVDLLGVGVHSYSRLGPYYYAQNIYEVSDYGKLVHSGKFPVYRGMKLNEDDIVRRDVIQQLRSYFFLDMKEFEKLHRVDFKEYFQSEIEDLDEFEKDGIVEIADHSIAITEVGQQFANLICRVFDTYIRSESPQSPENVPQFSHLERVLDRQGEF